MPATVDRDHLTGLIRREEATFEERHPNSRKLHERARHSMLDGVPMHWMTEWVGRFPVFVDHAEGARFTDVDGNEYVDLCLGDTGAMTGHSPPATVEAVEPRIAAGSRSCSPARTRSGSARR